MKNLYFIDEPSVISFSGGRTSAYMLYRILDAHNGELPEYAKVCFANTGKEMPQTLDFVKRCADEWNVNIVWLERYAREPIESDNSNNKYIYELKIVDYDSAARNGEPFSQLIKVRRYAPNPVARFCTQEMKIRAIRDYLVGYCNFELPYLGYIGIRADEPERAAKMNGTTESGQERYLPLYLDKITKKDIYNFWSKNSFDLELPNNGGVTDWGNCDLCFLKGKNKKIFIISQMPELADWWINEESELSELVGKGAYFRADQPSYAQMKYLAESQGDLFGYDDETSISCFCGE